MRVGVGPINDPDKMVHIASAFFEEFKIMGSDKALDRISDDFTVDFREKGDEIILKRVNLIFFDDIAVDTPLGTVSRMEIIIYPFDTLDPHGGGELDVEHLLEPLQIIPKVGKIDMDYLMGGMDAAVGATGGFGGGGDFKSMEDGDEMPHDGVIGIGLLLRTHKRRAVITQGDFGTVQNRFPTKRL